MDEPKADDAPTESAFARALTAATQPGAESIARGSGHISTRTDHSVMEGLPEAKKERIAGMRRELAEVQQQLIDAQQRVATELKGRADDAERFEVLEARMQAQELEAQRDAARAAELQTELADARSQLASATATAEETRKEVVARDAELATRTSERDAEHLIRSRLEGELEGARKQHREAAEQLEVQLAAVRDGKALAATRDAEVSKLSSERDALKVDLEQARRDLDAARAKSRDIANRIVGFGQDLLGGDVSAPPVVEVKPADPPAAPRRTQPPPLPQRPVAAPAPVPVETILEVTEQPKRGTSFLGSLLFVLGGLALGCAATLAFMNAGGSSSSADRQDLAAPPPSALAAPLATEQPQDTAPVSAPSAPPASPPAAPADTKTDGVIVLPAAASGHRVFVDGRIVEVKSSRAVVPCGSHQVRIGSSGTVRTLDIGCGTETAVPADPTDH